MIFDPENWTCWRSYTNAPESRKDNCYLYTCTEQQSSVSLVVSFGDTYRLLMYRLCVYGSGAARSYGLLSSNDGYSKFVTFHALTDKIVYTVLILLMFKTSLALTNSCFFSFVSQKYKRVIVSTVFKYFTKSWIEILSNTCIFLYNFETTKLV